MKIVMLCRLYWPHIGGVEKHVAGICREATSDGNSVDIFTLKSTMSEKTSEIKEGIQISRLHSWFPTNSSNGKVAKVCERIQIWSWILAHIHIFIQADVIHIHDVFYWYWPIRILLSSKKVYITYHGFEAGSLPTEKAKQTRQMIQSWTNGSIAVGSWIEKWYGTKPDIVTYGAAECNQTSKIQTTPSKKVRAVFIGRISDDTGANVYEKVIQSLEHVSLDIYGEGSKLGTVEDSCTVFLNYDIACVSSYLAIVEAMQSRVYVIAYASDELKYDYLLSHPRAKDMAIVRNEAELRDVLAHFSRERTDEQIQGAYDWARQQTWNRVYRKYLKLWGIAKYEN